MDHASHDHHIGASCVRRRAPARSQACLPWLRSGLLWVESRRLRPRVPRHARLRQLARPPPRNDRARWWARAVRSLVGDCRREQRRSIRISPSEHFHLRGASHRACVVGEGTGCRAAARRGEVEREKDAEGLQFDPGVDVPMIPTLLLPTSRIRLVHREISLMVTFRRSVPRRLRLRARVARRLRLRARVARRLRLRERVARRLQLRACVARRLRPRAGAVARCLGCSGFIPRRRRLLQRVPRRPDDLQRVPSASTTLCLQPWLRRR